MKKTVLITEANENKRIDLVLSEELSLTRSAAAKLLESGNVTLGERLVSKSLKVISGQKFEVVIPDPVPSEALPENIPLDIVYEDDDLLVVNKPSGMVVHPAAGNPSGTLVNALLYHCGSSLSGIGGVIRPGIVHRIDKDTSGLLVVAKNDETHLALSEQLKDHTVSRVYSAIACGNLKNDTGTIDAPIGRHPNDRKKMAVLRSSDSAREAITHYQVIERYRAFTYLKCVLETGRTHQIRVHMSSIGHPLLGDSVYGGAGTKFEARNKALIDGQCLHAGELSFIHPANGKKVHFECPLPEYFTAVIEKLRNISN
ncbi:MAG: RluA family pseudouridine synthase [Clostridia bacterium]|nr:RluA family pseudouridine synthase [Clostridia bacterium]